MKEFRTAYLRVSAGIVFVLLFLCVTITLRQVDFQSGWSAIFVAVWAFGLFAFLLAIGGESMRDD